MSGYKWTWDGPNLLEAILEILLAVAITLLMVWLGEEVFEWGQISNWEFAILYAAVYFTTRIRLR